MNVCRACLSTEKDLFELDDSFVCNYNLLTNLNVKPLDGKSQQFCKVCMETVNFFIDFRNKCASAESTLQGIYSEQTIKTETLESECDFVIKGEIKNEDDEVSFEDPDQEYEEDKDYSYSNSDYIKTEEDDVKVKKPRKQIKKQKSICAKVTGDIASEGNFILTTEEPACGLCAKIFNDVASLKEHLEGHKTDRSCKLCCTDTFESWPQLLAHRVLHTAYNKTCHLCDKKIRSSPYLELHYLKVHCGEKNAKLTCSHCPNKFATTRRLAKHIWSVHSQKEYHCDVCAKVFNNKQRLKFHIIGHGHMKRYACHLCEYSSKYAHGLNAHKIRRHTPGKCICKICERPFANPEKMAQHVCLDKSKICPVCGKQVRRGYSRHMEVHGEEKKFKCKRCPATHRTRLAHQAHLDKHDNNPRQECEFCHRRFYSKSVLVKHRRVHTGEKPYACNKCEMRFTGKHNLKVHMKVHGEMLIVKKNPAESV